MGSGYANRALQLLGVVMPQQKGLRPLSPEELAFLGPSPYGTSFDGGRGSSGANPWEDVAGSPGPTSGGQPMVRRFSGQAGGAQPPGRSEGLDAWGNPVNEFANANSPSRGPISGREPDTFGAMLEALKGGWSNQDFLRQILEGFVGEQRDFANFMENPAFRTMFAYGPSRTQEFQALKNLRDPSAQSLSVGLGQIGQAGARGIQDAVTALQQSGLGRSAGAMAGIRQQGAMDTGARSAAYQNAVQQQSYQNEMARLGTILDLEQAMAQLALGFSPTPRQPSNKASTGDWLALAGTLVGSAFGSPWLGAAVGAAAGAAGKGK